MSPEPNVASSAPKLAAIDPAVLQDVVRQDQREPNFEITDWTAEPLHGGFTAEAPLHVHGRGRSGHAEIPWSVVLKIVRAPEQEQDPRDLWYWKREYLLARSGLLADLPVPLFAPRFYETSDRGATAWIWMEYLVDAAPGRWGLDLYRLAARAIGRANAPYLVGLPVPDAPWLVQEHARQFTTGKRRLEYLEDPLVRRTLPATLRAGLIRLWDERERFFAALARLPQVFSQGDLQRRNLLLRRRPDGEDEIVAVDWGMCGRRAIGEDLRDLVASSTTLYDWEFDAIAELEEAGFDAYLAGLGDAGYVAQPEAVRLGYAASTALCIGAVMPFAIAVFGKDAMRESDLQRFGHPPEELIELFVALEEYSLDRGDEARGLMARLEV